MQKARPLMQLIDIGLMHLTDAEADQPARAPPSPFGVSPSTPRKSSVRVRSSWDHPSPNRADDNGRAK